MTNNSDKNSKTSDRWRPILLIIMVLTVIVLANIFGIAELLGDLRDWLQSLGPLGPLAFVIVYALSVATALPGSALIVVAGTLFGPLWGVICLCPLKYSKYLLHPGIVELQAPCFRHR